MRTVGVLAALMSLGVPDTAAGASAYVAANGVACDTPGSIAPFHTSQGAIGAAYFVPAGGNFLAIDPATKQVWEAVTGIQGDCAPPFSIYILNPKSGGLVANIPLDGEVVSLVFDAPGRYAYASLYNKGLVKIDVAGRNVVQTLAGGYGSLAFSSDASRLFAAEWDGYILALDPKTLHSLGSSEPSPAYLGASNLIVSGTTLLTTNSFYILYYDTNTLQLTKEILSQHSRVFGVSPDGSKIYVAVDPAELDPEAIKVLDFSSGETMLSQTYSGLYIYGSLLSPDGTKIVAPANTVAAIDALTLAITATVTAIGFPNDAIFVDSETVLMLYPDTGVMMVIDPSTALVTATFPLGLSALNGEVADPQRNTIFVGSITVASAGYPCCNTSVVDSTLNRIVGTLPAAFIPYAFAAGQIYSAYGEVYSLAAGAMTSLPPPIPNLPPNLHIGWYPGAAQPDGAAYWAPFSVYPNYGKTLGHGVAAYSTANNTLNAAFQIPSPTESPLAFSPDSSIAYVGSDRAVSVYNTATYRQTATFSLRTMFIALAVSPDGRNLYGNNGKAVFVLDAATGAEERKIELPGTVQGPMALSPDGATLFLTDSTANAVDLVNPASGAVTVVPVPYSPTSVVVLP